MRVERFAASPASLTAPAYALDPDPHDPLPREREHSRSGTGTPTVGGATITRHARMPKHIEEPSIMSDPVFIVMGASSGIGDATTRRAVGAAHRVALAARSGSLAT